MKNSFPALLAAVTLAAAIPTSPAHAQATGRYIIRLKETPPPPKLFRIQEHLEGQYRSGGRRSPYVVVTPKSRSRPFVLPRKLKTVVAYVEPEVFMYAIFPAHLQPPPDLRPLERLALRVRPPRPGIGRPASGTGEKVPESAQAPVTGLTPNDQYFSYQWGMLDTGSGIRLPLARRYGKGAGVLVGIVDSGVRANLSDLAGVSFAPPYNAMTSAPGGTDDNGHGSHVCGTIAQATDNRIGCAGVAPLARILSVKALDLNGRGTNFTIAAGIRYAVDAGCKIVNCSIGGSPSRTLQDAVRYAASRETLLICSSGNGGNAAVTYPAAYPETLSVGAIESNGVRAGFSQYGPELLRSGVVAPGVEILQQTFRRGTGAPGYFYFSGTSMAAPMVTGTAALVKSLAPNLSRAELKLLLMGTATDLGPRGADAQYGAGLVNAAAACERAMRGTAPPGPPGPPGPPVEPPVTPVPPVDPGAAGMIAEVLSLVNAAREEAGVPALSLHPQLNQAAASHAADMRMRGVMSHTGGDGSGPGTRIARAGYQAITWGENIAAGFPTAAAVMSAWMNSAGHRANILNPNFKELGVAKDGAYWCQVFGARRQ